MTILQLAQNSSNELMKALKDALCDETIIIHVTKDNAIIRLNTNEETYIRTTDEEWKKATK